MPLASQLCASVPAQSVSSLFLSVCLFINLIRAVTALDEGNE